MLHKQSHIRHVWPSGRYTLSDSAAANCKQTTETFFLVLVGRLLAFSPFANKNLRLLSFSAGSIKITPNMSVVRVCKNARSVEKSLPALHLRFREATSIASKLQCRTLRREGAGFSKDGVSCSFCHGAQDGWQMQTPISEPYRATWTTHLGLFSRLAFADGKHARHSQSV